MGILLKLGVLLLIGILTPIDKVSSEEIRVLAHNNEFPPYLFTENGQKIGFYVDFFDAIASLTGDQFTFHYHPITRGLVMFGQNQVDVEPGVNPAWRSGEKVPGIYTLSYRQSIDIILFAPGKKIAVNTPADLKEKRLGVVRGYQYPGFTTLFQRGDIERYDVTAESQLLNMLLSGRLDQVIINKDLALYRIQRDPIYQNLEVGYQVSSVDVMLRVHPNKIAFVSRANLAIKELIESGKLDKIWDKYR